MKEEALKKLGLKSDPFDINTPSPKLIGLEKQEAQLIDYLADTNSILLYGPTGLGKTTLVTNLAERVNKGGVSQLKNYKCLYYACDLDKFLKFKWDFNIVRLFGFGKKLIVILDEAAFWNTEDLMRINAMWRVGKIDAVLYVQINEKLRDIQIDDRVGRLRVQVESLSTSQIYELLKERQGNVKIFDDKALMHIAYNCMSNPRTALQMCKLAANKLAESNKPITLDQVKNFDFGKFEKAEVREEMAPKLEDNISKLNLSPLKEQIVRQLRISSMTIKQLAEACNTGVKTISARLSEMEKDKQVVVVEAKRPKKFGLNPKFEKSIVGD